jgi:spore coat-associated protein N
VTRLHRLAAHPRRTLGALAVVLAAVGITVGSGASFTASAANPGNAFSTGTLVIANSPSTALLSVTGMKPGDTSSSTVDITNTGSLALLGQMQLTVLDCGAWTTTAPGCTTGTTSVYSGTVSGLTNSTLGNYAGGIKHRYKFTATLPSSTDDTYQGKTAQVDFAWSATQS